MVLAFGQDTPQLDGEALLRSYTAVFETQLDHEHYVTSW